MNLPRSLRSFRLRLALFSAGCTAAILVLLGIVLYFWLLRAATDEVTRQFDRQIRNLLLLAFPGALLLSFGAAALVVQRALRPIRTITDGSYRYIRNLTPQEIYIQKHLMGIRDERNLNSLYWHTWVAAAFEDPSTYDLVKRYIRRPPRSSITPLKILTSSTTWRVTRPSPRRRRN